MVTLVMDGKDVVIKDKLAIIDRLRLAIDEEDLDLVWSLTNILGGMLGEKGPARIASSSYEEVKKLN